MEGRGTSRQLEMLSTSLHLSQHIEGLCPEGFDSEWTCLPGNPLTLTKVKRDPIATEDAMLP